MQVATYPPLSEEEYLALEARSPVRHEYVDGNVYAMTGVSLRHNVIAGNVASLLTLHEAQNFLIHPICIGRKAQAHGLAPGKPAPANTCRIQNMQGENSKSTDVVWHHATVTRARREALNGHRGAILWFTGLSGAGKSTVAHAVEERLHQLGCRTFVFDGDNVRHGLCGDLSFSAEDRTENIRRIGEMTKLFLEAGVISLTAFISPFRRDRERVRSLVPHGDFLEIYCRCPLAVCDQRDPKGLYKKARAGLIKEFTGVSSPYEEPEAPELMLDTDRESLEDCVERVLGLLRERDMIAHAAA